MRCSVYRGSRLTTLVACWLSTSWYFATNAAKLTAELEDPYILIHEKKITNARELIPVLEQTAQTSRPLLIGRRATPHPRGSASNSVPAPSTPFANL